MAHSPNASTSRHSPTSPRRSPAQENSLAPPTPQRALLSPLSTHSAGSTPSPANILTPQADNGRSDLSPTAPPGADIHHILTDAQPTSKAVFGGLLSPLPDIPPTSSPFEPPSEESRPTRKRSYSFLRTSEGKYLGTEPGRTIYSAKRGEEHPPRLEEIAEEKEVELVVNVNATGSKYFWSGTEGSNQSFASRTAQELPLPPSSQNIKLRLEQLLDPPSTPDPPLPRVTLGSPEEDEPNRQAKRSRLFIWDDEMPLSESPPSSPEVLPSGTPPALPPGKIDPYTPPPRKLRLKINAPSTPLSRVVPPYVGIPSPNHQQELLSLTEKLLAPITYPPPKPVMPIHPTLLYTPGNRGIKIRKGEPIAKGTTIMSANPLFGTLHGPLLGKHCSGCFQSPAQKAMLEGKEVKVIKKGFVVCQWCQTAAFCSLKCYVKCAHDHFPECRAFKLLQDDEELPRTVVLIVAKICWRQANTGREVKLPDFTLPSAISRDMKQTHRDVNEVCRLISKKGDGKDIDWMRFHLDDEKDSVRRIVQRTVLFPIVDHASHPIGLCIQPGLAHFDHSCCPDAIVTYPHGPGVDRPMRVILLEKRWGGEPLRISYVDPGTPYHQRDGVLGIHGFRHECKLCARPDVRWMAKHPDCEMEGHVVRWNGTARHRERCSGCGKEARVDLHETPFQECMQRVRFSIMAERGGVLGTVMNRNIDEASLLTVELSTLLDYFPDTSFPIPLLQRRLARLLTQMSPSITRAEQAIELFESAIGACKDINEGDWSPVVLALLVERIETQFKAITIILDEDEQEHWLASPKDQVKAKLLWERKRKRMLTEGLKQLVGATSEAMVDAEQMGDGVLVVKARRYYERTRKLFKLLNFGDTS